MARALARHDEILSNVVHRGGGHIVKSTGDGVHAVFGEVSGALAAAVDAQREVSAEPWNLTEPLRVRIGLHSGNAQARAGDYFGTAVNRAARLMGVAHGGQVLISNATEQLAREALPSGVELQPVGELRLRNLVRPERVFQVIADGLERQFPPLASWGPGPIHLPAQLTRFVGRVEELDDLSDLLEQHRLVSLIGSGGAGKTRLAIELGRRTADRFGGGVWFVDLAAVSDPELVAQTTARALGEQEVAGRTYVETLLARLDERETLLVFDNCEQLLESCAQLV